MRIKHWQGYGTVNATKLSISHAGNKTNLRIRVNGNHEYGVTTSDPYHLKRWLIDRFDKNNQITNPYNIEIKMDSRYETTANGCEECCVYDFSY